MKEQFDACLVAVSCFERLNVVLTFDLVILVLLGLYK